jgi:hypothetical protein
MSAPKLPKILEKFADAVLAHKPKPKTKAAKKRKSAQTARRKDERKQAVPSPSSSDHDSFG